jgi:hypothetical protein
MLRQNHSNIVDSITHNTSTQIISDTDTNKNYKYCLNLTANGSFPKLVLKNVTTKETEKVVFSLHLKNSSGYDEISTKTLKISAPHTSSPLCYIYIIRQSQLENSLHI